MRKIAAMTYAPLGIRTVRSTSEESGLVTSLEGEGEMSKIGNGASWLLSRNRGVVIKVVSREL